MITKLMRVTIVVRDEEEALNFYTEKLGFVQRADETFGPGVRWLTVAPRDQKHLEIVLQKPNPLLHGEAGAKELEERIGKGTAWVFGTDDCRKTYETLKARGVKFLSPPQEQHYGVQAIFEDLYGNQFVLVEPRP
ncbi:MAG: VOC family protein [Chloroflexi bacterium]|nr:VOC family protein [Chloroflexota bacterium]